MAIMQPTTHKRHSPKMRGGFYLVYAILFILSIGLACGFYLNQSYQRSYTHNTLHAKVQLQLYARSLKNMIMLCLREREFGSCQNQEFYLPQNYHFRTALTKLDTQSILLDIHGSILHPSSSNTLRVTKRYIVFIPTNSP